MKKIIAVFFLLICGLIILLATVDLEPYLASDQPVVSEKETPPSTSLPDEPPIKPIPNIKNETSSTVGPNVEPIVEQTVTQTEIDKLENLLENLKPAATVDEIIAEQKIATTPTTAGVNITEEDIQQGQTAPALIELEVTVLPVGEYPFSILLDTFLEQERAQQTTRLYQERGISAHWVKVNLGEKGVRYRLFSGIFSTVPEAQQYLAQNQLYEKLIKPTYYSARIGVYRDKAQLASDFVKSRDTGVIPYILGTEDGVYHLYVGAFYTYIGATSQCRELTTAGLNCEPVRRSTFPPQQP
jgi:hypothetical protein